MSGVWAVLDDYSFTPIEVERETAQTVFYIGRSGKTRRAMNALPWRGDEDGARRLSEQLKSAQAEKQRRVQAANAWFGKRKAELLGANA